jgi:hypothetical protein
MQKFLGFLRSERHPLFVGLKLLTNGERRGIIGVNYTEYLNQCKIHAETDGPD